MGPIRLLSASYESDSETSEPALTPPASDTTTEPNKSFGETEDGCVISGDGLLGPMVPQNTATFATGSMANANVVSQSDLETQTNPIDGLMHIIEYINHHLPMLNAIEIGRLQQLVSAVYARRDEVKDTNTALPSSVPAHGVGVTVNENRHNFVKLKGSMVKKISEATEFKQHQAPKVISQAHPLSANQSGIERGENSSYHGCPSAGNASIDSGGTVNTYIAAPNPKHEPMSTYPSLNCTNHCSEQERHVDSALASRKYGEGQPKEGNQLLDRTLLQSKALAISFQNTQLHSDQFEETHDKADWIEKAVQGNTPKLNTLEEVWTQMQSQKIHMNGARQHPNEQRKPSDTSNSWGISELSSEQLHYVFRDDVTCDEYLSHVSPVSGGTTADQHERCATLDPVKGDSAITCSTAEKKVKHIESPWSASKSGIEQSVLEDAANAAHYSSNDELPIAPDNSWGYDPNSIAEADDYCNSGTDTDTTPDNDFGGDCWGSAGEDTRWGSEVPSTKFSVAHEPAPSVPGSSVAGKSRKNNIPTEDNTTGSKPYTVTYWVTVECGDQITHIPVDSNNVTGPEKSILDGPARRVWKWVQDKGLDDKISLQDAYDLAKDMQLAETEQHSEEKDEIASSSKTHSCAGSSVTIYGERDAALSPYPWIMSEAARTPHHSSSSVGWGRGCGSRSDWST